MKKILVIEDSSELQQLYLDALTQKGFQASFATTAQKGIGMMQAEQPDLLVLDIMLPGGGNGFDILEQMKRDPRLATVPVVIVTNLDSEEKTARDIGVKDYIVKSSMPFSMIITRIVEATT
jgi:DNA-binding response OmpR family regulator